MGVGGRHDIIHIYTCVCVHISIHREVVFRHSVSIFFYPFLVILF